MQPDDNVDKTVPDGVVNGAPAGAPAGVPAGAPAGVPAGVPAGAPTEVPAGVPAGLPAGASADAPAGAPAGQVSYADAGVDNAASDRAVERIRAAVNSTYTPEVIGDIGGFGGLFSAAGLQGLKDPVLVSGTDGVGTKLALAKRTGRHSTVGIDLVAMCVNDIAVTGAKPLFFLDYIAIGRLDEDLVAEVVGGIADGCRQAGCALVGGEMAEHPGVMQPDEYDLAGFAVGVVERAEMLLPERVQPGDQVIGLASSGLHSNGYSLVRHAWTDQLSDAELNSARLSDGRLLAEALMQPTVIYAQALLAARQALAGGLRAAAHITGGGVSENIPRALPDGLEAHIDLSTWPLPEVVRLACEAAYLSQEEAYKTFNMGIGLAIIVAPEALDEALGLLGAYHDAYHIGSIEAASDAAAAGRVVYRGAPAFAAPDAAPAPAPGPPAAPAPAAPAAAPAPGPPAHPRPGGLT